MRYINQSLFAITIILFLTANYDAVAMEEQVKGKEERELSPATQALIKAVKAGDIAAARAAIHGGANVNAQVETISPSGFAEPPYPSILAYAIANGDLPMTKFLVYSGHARFDPHTATQEEDSLLNFAARSGNVELAQWLIGEGAPINIRSGYNSLRPIDEAIFYGHRSMVDFLIQKDAHIAGGRPDLVSFAVMQSRKGAAEENNTIYFLELALANGYDINAIGPGRIRPLRFAIGNNQLRLARWLLEHGAMLTPSVEEALKATNIKSIFQHPLLDAIAFRDQASVMGKLASLRNKPLQENEIQLIQRAFMFVSAQGLTDVVRYILSNFEHYLNDETLGAALERAAMNGHINAFDEIFLSQRPAIEGRQEALMRSLLKALLAAAAQRKLSMVDHILTKIFVFKLEIPIDVVIRQVMTLREQSQLNEQAYKELGSLLEILKHHYFAMKAGRAAINTEHLLQGLSEETLRLIHQTLSLRGFLHQ